MEKVKTSESGEGMGSAEAGTRPLPFDLNLIDRATAARYELDMLSEFASCAATARAATETESNVFDAVSLTIDRVSHVLGELIGVASELNARSC